ncbi:MAG TPA: branched-chain amino acid transaminase [Candidatus Methanomethylophilaceae archaeon]|nr:branched-chain amino acid transaminase [Candidatus Methanomethylophilaceae archaeon]
MEKGKLIWLNGKLVKWDDAKIHVMSHALNYGTGVFEGIRIYDTPKGESVFRLKDHVHRIIGGCKVMGFDMVFGGKEYSEKDIYDAILQTVRENDNVDYVKPCIFLSGEEVGLNPVGVPVSMSISAMFMGNYLGESDSGMKLITSSWHRPDNLCSPAGAKVNGSYVTSCLAKREAVNQGADEAVMLNSLGHVAECTGENIFIYKDGRIMTPPPSESILEGITRNSIIEVARDMGYSVEEVSISRTQLITADEVWMTGTAAEVASVTMIDARTIGNGKVGDVARKIGKKFHDIVTGKDLAYEKWLDYVN